MNGHSRLQRGVIMNYCPACGRRYAAGGPCGCRGKLPVAIAALPPWPFGGYIYAAEWKGSQIGGQNPPEPNDPGE